MESQVFHVLKDMRVSCYSILTVMSVENYLHFISRAYDSKGGLEGQRAPLKTNTAIRIRKRMVEDLKLGAVLPPIVVGVIIDDETMAEFEKDAILAFEGLLSTTPDDMITIIDGMQRTTALFEAYGEISPKTEIRVEFWIATTTNSLIYRMLILNTGQIPWNLKRQLEVVFSQLSQELSTRIPSLELIKTDDPYYRKNAGQYQASDFIELFLLFGTRKYKVDINEHLAEEFARLDLIQATSNNRFVKAFITVAELLVKLDKAFSRPSNSNKDLVRFGTGKDIFSSQPARIGFVVACARYIMGKPGIERPETDQKNKLIELEKKLQAFLGKIDRLSDDELTAYLGLPVLDQLLSTVKSGKVGEFEREFFTRAFDVILDEGVNLDSLVPSWRALL